MLPSWNVKYFDGEKAEAILARVTIEGHQLIIRDQNQQQLDVWTIQSIQYDPNHLDYKFLLTTVEPHARIEMIDPDMMKHFESIKKTSWQKILESKKIIAISLLAVASLVIGLYFATQPLSRFIAQKIPSEYEAKLAQQLKYDEMFHICRPTKGPDRDQYQFILKLKQLYPDTISELVDLNKIKVIQMNQANAFALPGGYIFLTDELINQAKSYEEIIGILAHEKGHVVHRHHLQSIVRGSLLTTAANFITGDVTSFILMDPSTVMSIVSLKFNREDETEADRYAVDHVLNKMNLTSQGMIDFFERSSVKEKEIKENIPGFLLTHPGDQERIQFLKGYLKEAPLTEIDPDDNINVLCD